MQPHHADILTSVEEQEDGTSCGLFAATYIAGLFSHSENIFNQNLIDSEFSGLHQSGYFKVKEPVKCRHAYSDIIQSLFDKRETSEEDDINKEGDEDDEVEGIIAHPGEGKFYNKWEAEAYNIPGLEDVISNQGQRRQERTDRKTKRRINRNEMQDGQTKDRDGYNSEERQEYERQIDHYNRGGGDGGDKDDANKSENRGDGGGGDGGDRNKSENCGDECDEGEGGGGEAQKRLKRAIFRERKMKVRRRIQIKMRMKMVIIEIMMIRVLEMEKMRAMLIMTKVVEVVEVEKMRAMTMTKIMMMVMIRAMPTLTMVTKIMMRMMMVMMTKMMVMVMMVTKTLYMLLYL